MQHFTATLTTKDTSKNVRGFCKEHMNVFWKIWAPLLPFFLGLYALDVYLIHTGALSYEIYPGALVASYFLTVLAITWHRVVLHGPDNYVPMNPFKPKKYEIFFILGGIAILVMVVLAAVLGGFIVGFFSYFLPSVLKALVGVAGILCAVIFALFLSFRLSFYLPAKALNASISFKQAYKLSKGYSWKMFASYIRASIRMVGLTFLVSFVLMFLLSVFTDFSIIPDMQNMPKDPAEQERFIAEFTRQNVLPMFFVQLPVYIFFTPIFTVLWVTVLSNYYQHALQNKPVSEAAA